MTALAHERSPTPDPSASCAMTKLRSVPPFSRALIGESRTPPTVAPRMPRSLAHVQSMARSIVTAPGNSTSIETDPTGANGVQVYQVVEGDSVSELRQAIWCPG